MGSGIWSSVFFNLVLLVNLLHIIMLFVMSSTSLISATNFFQQLILDFLDEVIQKPTVLIGNSVGSLACVIAAAGWNGFSCSKSVILEHAGMFP